MDGPLRTDVGIEQHRGVALDGNGVFDLLVEGCLIVEAGGESEEQAVVELGYKSDGGSG